MKWEVAIEFGIQLGADRTSQGNGSVGGEMVKRMITLAESQIGGGITVPMMAQTQQQAGGTTISARV